MPANDALGSDHDQVSPPVTAEGANHHPEELVAGRETGPLPSPPRLTRIAGTSCRSTSGSVRPTFAPRQVATRPLVLISARGVTAPHIIGKGRAAAHPKSLERVTVCRPRATLRPTRAKPPKRTLRAEVAQRLNVVISAPGWRRPTFCLRGRSLLHIPDKGRRVKPSSYGVVQELATSD
jgi:hypothetical protein